MNDNIYKEWICGWVGLKSWMAAVTEMGYNNIQVRKNKYLEISNRNILVKGINS